MKDILEFDLVLIGGGGCLKLVSRAIKNNLKVAVIEKNKLGGTCLNRGCIPSKMFIYPSYISQKVNEYSKFGLNLKFNKQEKLSKLTSRINEKILNESNSVVLRYQENPNITFFNKQARFLDDNLIEIIGEDKIVLRGKKVVIGVGSRTYIPPIKGLNKTPFLISDDILKLKKLPKKIVIVGGGYIAVELGNALASYGCDVHFLVLGKMIPREDRDIIEEFENIFSKKRKVHKISLIEEVNYNEKFKIKYLTQGGEKKSITSDQLLLATGVKPNTDLLGIENTNIKLNKYGFIKVNKKLETNVKNVYAIGDCVGNYMYRHSVNFEGEYLANLFYSNKNSFIKYPPMPHAIFTDPQVAGVGKTEDQLILENTPYFSVKHEFKNSAMGMATLPETGFVKLLFHKENLKFLGGHIIGDEASILIHILIVYITMNAKLNDMEKMIYVHPALPEVIRNAIRDARRFISK